MTDYKKALEKVALFVLEDWAMMMPEPSDEPSFESAQRFYQARMRYRGEHGKEGEIAILCQLGFMEALARNLLGLDFGDDVAEEQAVDALREMANVLTGHFVTESYGVDEPFELLSPGAAAATAEDVAAFFEREGVCFSADDEQVAVNYLLPKES